MATKGSLESQLAEIERLKARGVLNDEEYETRRAAIIASPEAAVAVKEGGSAAKGIFKWGFFGCLGMVAAIVVLFVVLALIIAAASKDERKASIGTPGAVGTNPGDVHVAFGANASGEIAPEGNPERRIRVTILQSADNVQSSNRFLKPPDGKKWYGVEVLVQNVGTKEVTSPNWKLRDTQDGEHDLDIVVDAGNLLDPVFNLTPGGKLQGWIYFAIPVDAAPKWLRADPNVFLKNDLYFDVR